MGKVYGLEQTLEVLVLKIIQLEIISIIEIMYQIQTHWAPIWLNVFLKIVMTIFGWAHMGVD